MELADGTDPATEAPARKETLDQEAGSEVADEDPSRPPRAVPQREGLVGPQIEVV